MASSITTKDLEAKVVTLNELTGSPKDQYTRTDRAQVTANEGNYHLQWAYGGVKLCRNSKAVAVWTYHTMASEQNVSAICSCRHTLQVFTRLEKPCR